MNGPFVQSLCQSAGFLLRRTPHASAQSIDFLDLAQTGNLPRRAGTESRNVTKQIAHFCIGNLTLTLQICAEEKRVSVRQMWLRAVSGRPKRT